MMRFDLIRDLYSAQRDKRHGAGPASRRMAMTLAISAWAIATRRPWIQIIIYRYLPMWIKTAWRERYVTRK